MTRSELMAYLHEQAALPFEWGKTDCVQLCAGLIERVTGVRPVLPAYSTEIGAARVLKDLGGLQGAVSSFLGPMQRHRPDCLDGDIVLTVFQGEAALGIATPPVFWARRVGGVGGLAPIELTLANGFWPCRNFLQR